MEKISGTYRVGNEEVLQAAKEEMNILHILKRKKCNWVGHILHWNCLLKRVIEGKVEERIKAPGRRRRRRKQVLDDLKETREFWNLKEEAPEGSLCRNRFLRGCGFIARHTKERMT